MADTDQRIKGDNNRQTIIEKAYFDNYEALSDDNAGDAGVIDTIFKYVLDNSQVDKNLSNSRVDKLLNTTRKININFKLQQEREDITEFCKFASDKIALIEKSFSELASNDQNDVHSYILGKYSHNRTKGVSNMANFYSLCEEFIPMRMKKNPKYQNIARSFVLFFFQDCTIFEKTEIERKNNNFNDKQLKIDFEC